MNLKADNVQAAAMETDGGNHPGRNGQSKI